MPQGYSRHYYNTHRLATSPIRERALGDLELLRQVVEFKQRFYPCGWAQYEDAKPGTFRLMPGEARLRTLRRDYRDMNLMIFGETPDFETMMDTLKQLEDDIDGH